MSAELLRRAAAKMREGATAVDPDNPRPWEAIDEIDGDTIVDTGGASLGGCPDCGVRAGFDRAEAEYIASWHPAVALAVADLLDELLRSLSVFGEPSDDDPLWEKPTASKCLALARAYLGES